MVAGEQTYPGPFRFAGRGRAASAVAGDVAGDVADFLAVFAGIFVCVGEHLGEGGNFGALQVLAAAASMTQWPEMWPELWPRGSAGRVLPFLSRFHGVGLVGCKRVVLPFLPEILPESLPDFCLPFLPRF
ncbi:MAG: hypothetical protein ACXWQ5_23335 [Ktedonobacterales bacterium]